MSQNKVFNCPECGKFISLTMGKANIGKDAFGEDYATDFTAKPIREMGNITDKTEQGPRRKAFIPRKGTYEIQMADGTVRILEADGNNVMLPAYNEGDGSLSDLFKEQFPGVPCKIWPKDSGYIKIEG